VLFLSSELKGDACHVHVLWLAELVLKGR